MKTAAQTYSHSAFTWIFSLLLLAACQSPASTTADMDTYPNLPLPTLGGRQLWADVQWYAGWRVQQHVWTGHCRLLDEKDVRRAWGQREACESALDTACKEQGLALKSEHLVVLLHGLGRSRSSMTDMQKALLERGYEVMDVGYPSTRKSLAEHAEQVNTLLDSLARTGEVKQVSFITHSLGGILARATMAAADLANASSDAAQGSWRNTIQVNRLAMLAPPSSGSAFAESLKDFLPFQWFAGDSGQQVTLTEARNLPLPNCQFAVVAGHRKEGKGWNPLLRGEDDGVVRVEETRLPGAEDFWVVEGLHSFLMDNPVVIQGVIRYLEHGSFQSDS